MIRRSAAFYLMAAAAIVMTTLGRYRSMHVPLCMSFQLLLHLQSY